MKYPAMPACQSGTLTVGQLDGGVNLSLPSDMIADNELSEGNNLWWEKGALRLRPAFTRRNCLSLPSTPSKIQLTDVFCPYKGQRCRAGYMLFPDAVHLLAVHEDGNYEEFGGYTGVFDHCLIVRGLPLKGCGMFIFTGNSTVLELSGQYDELLVVDEKDFYAPLILVNGHPTARVTDSGSGTAFEGANLLSRWFRCSFSPEEGKYYYSLPFGSITDAVTVTLSTDNGVTASATIAANGDTAYFSNGALGYTGSGHLYVYLNRVTGRFFFGKEENGSDTPISPYNTTARNSVVIRATASKYVSDNPVKACTVCTWFGGDRSGYAGGTRLFMAGGRDNRVFWSDLNNPLYFPEHNYAAVGDCTPVTALARQGNLLLMFKAQEIYSAQYVAGKVSAEAVSAGTAVNVESYTASFPITPVHPSVGCDCPDTLRLCQNRLVWLTSDGNVYGLFGTGQYSSGNVRRLSTTIAPWLEKQSAGALMAAHAAVWQGRYMLCIGRTVLLTDVTGAAFAGLGSLTARPEQAARWFFWSLPLDIGTVHSITDDGTWMSLYGHLLYTLRQDGTATDDLPGGVVPISGSFATRAFDMGSANRKKDVTALYLFFADRTAPTAVTCRTEQGTTYHTIPAGEAGEVRLSPHITRCRRFAVGGQGTNALALRGFSLRFVKKGRLA